MRYIRPQIIAHVAAVSAIQVSKGMVPFEINDATALTNGAAYQADE
jgi:hypothetical protein